MVAARLEPVWFPHTRFPPPGKRPLSFGGCCCEQQTGVVVLWVKVGTCPVSCFLVGLNESTHSLSQEPGSGVLSGLGGLEMVQRLCWVSRMIQWLLFPWCLQCFWCVVSECGRLPPDSRSNRPPLTRWTTGRPTQTLRYLLPPFPVLASSRVLVVTNEPSDLSRMTCRRRSSAGGPRRWRGQDTRNTSSEEQIDSVRLVLDVSSCVLVCILVQYPPAPPDGVHRAHVPEAAGDGHHAQSLVWLRRQVWTSGGPHGQGETPPAPQQQVV